MLVPTKSRQPKRFTRTVKRQYQRAISTTARSPVSPSVSQSIINTSASFQYIPKRGFSAYSDALPNVKTDNPSSYHPPVFQARPIKVNISNLFDSRADFKRETANLDLRFEIGHDGQNIDQDVDQKCEWVDKHHLNEWYDIMLDRFCPSISKKSKQLKPSNYRQSRARKMHKQSKEKALATSIRDSIDNTPRYAGFQKLLAENKKLFGTYNPSAQDIEKSGLDVDKLSTHLRRSFPDRDFGI